VERLPSLLRRHWFDALIVLGAIMAALEVTLRLDKGPFSKTTLWLATPATLLMILPLLARRRFPFGAPASIFLYLGALSFADGRLVAYTLTAFLTVLSCAYLLGMLEDRRQSLVGIAIAIGAAEIVGYNNPRQHVGDYFFIPLVFGVAWFVGFGLGGRLREGARAEERALQLEQEREERARAAVEEERARIARELHDVVGHSVSVMTVQASAVRRLLRPEQQREREALLVVERTGREALAEMRRMVGVLRRPEEAPALAPQPSLEHVEKLVDQARDAGLPVDLRVEGEARELPVGVDLTAYRLVQEGLTNALKHARARHAEVLVRYSDGHIELTVSDDGLGVGSGDGGGQGLVGMRERVSVYGGELEAGPRAEGGYRLRARLPVASA
jgi:signal transduction histidine kinase